MIYSACELTHSARGMAFLIFDNYIISYQKYNFLNERYLRNIFNGVRTISNPYGPYYKTVMIPLTYWWCVC